MDSIISAFVAGFLGVVSALLGAWFVGWREKKRKERFSASLLHNELKSIERYLIYDEKSLANIRYSDNWQNIIADCSFLNDNDISFLYLIYDEIYYYNYLFRLKEEGKGVEHERGELFKKLRERIFNISINERYYKLTKRLEKHTKNISVYKN